MLKQLIPISANMSEDIHTMVESHVLERNKYEHKFPTLEFATPDPEVTVEGVNKHLYSWKYGHAPVDASQNENALWWKERAERDLGPLSINSSVDVPRDTIHSGTLAALTKSWSTPYHFENALIRKTVDESGRRETRHAWRALVNAGADDRALLISQSLVQSRQDITDVLNPSKKVRIGTYALASGTAEASPSDIRI